MELLSVMRIVAIILLISMTLLGGIYTGGVSPFINAAGWTVAMALLAVFLGLFVMRGTQHQVGTTFVLLCVAYLGYVYGSKEQGVAYNDCVERSEIIRQNIVDFQKQNGRFPDDLSEIKIALCGRRILRPPLLDYRKTESGFELVFSDWLMSWVGTEVDPMLARK
jgi:hypothetical protein